MSVWGNPDQDFPNTMVACSVTGFKLLSCCLSTATFSRYNYLLSAMISCGRRIFKPLPQFALFGLPIKPGPKIIPRAPSRDVRLSIEADGRLLSRRNRSRGSALSGDDNTADASFTTTGARSLREGLLPLHLATIQDSSPPAEGSSTSTTNHENFL